MSASSKGDRFFSTPSRVLNTIRIITAVGVTIGFALMCIALGVLALALVLRLTM